MNYLYTILVGILVSVSGGVDGACDQPSAVHCMNAHSDGPGVIKRPNTCNDWYKCVEDNHCSAEEVGMVPSREVCHEMEACDLGQYKIVDRCYTQNTQCSHLRQCLADVSCITVVDYYYYMFCPSGVSNYCTAAAMWKAQNCFDDVKMKHGVECSMMWDCMKPNNCDKFPGMVSALEAVGCGKASCIFSSFLSTASLVLLALMSMA